MRYTILIRHILTGGALTLVLLNNSVIAIINILLRKIEQIEYYSFNVLQYYKKSKY